MASVHEQLSRQFYQWESRGRGWRVFDEPVYPEPPFQFFNGYRLPTAEVVDDGRKPTFLSSLFRQFSRPSSPVMEEAEPEPEPVPLVRDALVEFQAALPAELNITRESFGHFIDNLSLCREPVAFELLGTHKRVVAQFATSPEDASTLRRQLKAHFPAVEFRQLSGELEKTWFACDNADAFAVEFGLESEFLLSLATGKPDVFVGIVGALAELGPGELGLFQVLWHPVQNPWAESIVNAVTNPEGKPIFVNAPELAGAAEAKVTSPLYAAVVRLLLRTASASRIHEIAREIAAALRVFSNPEGNALIPLDNAEYPFEAHLEDILRRQSRRCGMILNREELTGFIHLPTDAVQSPVLVRDSGRAKAAPDNVRRATGILIGDNEHNGEVIPVYLTPEQRVRHTHIIGSNGTGKSSLLLNMIRQDIEHGDGLAVLDPHGDLIDQILGLIPEGRKADVVLVDLDDGEFPIGFNLLQAHSEVEKRLLASDLVGVFRRLSRTWGDQMDTVLQNAILAFLKSSRGGTLADLRQFLRDDKFRTAFLPTIRDPEVLDFWQEIFPRLGRDKSVSSLLSRLQEFFSQEPLRNMVSQPVNKLDFADIMDSGKIFLAKLSTGLGGEENSYLLGTLLISKFQQLAMARQAQKMEMRRDFWLYIDEFQHFISPSMERILTGARKYRLGFTLAHQNLHQLNRDANVASAVLTQPCTRIVLQVGDDDAKKLGEGFDSFDAKSLTRLEKYHALVRVERNDCDFNIALRKPEWPPEAVARFRRDQIIAASRERYGTPRHKVEEFLLAKLNAAAKRSESPERPFPQEVKRSTPATSVAPPRPDAVPSTSKIPDKALPQVSNVALQSDERVKPYQDAVADASAKLKPEMLATPDPGLKIQPEAKSDFRSEDGSHDGLADAITKEAESLDYSVKREKVIPHGRIDLVLTRGKKSIACEVSCTTPPEKEADHIHSRLNSGFHHVAVVSGNRRKLELIQQAYSKRSLDQDSPRVGFYVPDEFFNQLFKWAQEDPRGGEIEKGKPRRRQIIFGSRQLTQEERSVEERRLLDEMAKRMKRK